MFLTRVCAILEEHGVMYALVGGHAVALHGAARGTLDIDFVIERSLAAYEATEQALRSLGLTPYLPVTARYVFENTEELMRQRNLVAWSFVNRDNPMEIVDVIIGYDATTLGIDQLEIADSTIRVISLADLKKMKREAGRPQDIADCEALDQLERSK